MIPLFKHKRSIICISISLIIVSALFLPERVMAEGDKLSVPFTVSPVLPDNQRTGVLGYFDLLVEPGLKQTIHVKLRNDTDRALTMDITPTNALTAVNGGIQYVVSEGSDGAHFTDKSYAIKSMITVNPKVTVNAGATVDIPVIVGVPDTDSGTFLGGLLFTAEDNNVGHVNESGKDANFTVNNHVAVAMAIQLDLPKPAQPVLSFGDAGIQTIPSGSQLYFGMNNDAPSIIRGITGNFEVSNSSGVIMKGSFGPFNMAPKTEIGYPVFWDNNLSPGKYNVKLNAQYEGQNISQEKSFTIGVEDLKEYYEITGRNPIPFTIPWWVWGVGGSGFLAIILIVYMLGRRHGNSQTKDQ